MLGPPLFYGRFLLHSECRATRVVYLNFLIHCLAAHIAPPGSILAIHHHIDGAAPPPSSPSIASQASSSLCRLPAPIAVSDAHLWSLWVLCMHVHGRVFGLPRCGQARNMLACAAMCCHFSLRAAYLSVLFCAICILWFHLFACPLSLLGMHRHSPPCCASSMCSRTCGDAT